MRALWPCRIALATVLGCASITSAWAASSLTRNATLEVSVREVVHTPPDQAIISFGIAAIGPTTAEARAAVRPQAESLIQLLKASGVADRALVLGRNDLIEEVREEWIESEELIEGEIIGHSVRVTGSIELTDMALAQRAIDVLARQGIHVTFNVDYRLNAETAEKATQRARAEAVRQARVTAIAIAKQQGWKIAEMLPPRRPLPADGKADLGGPGPEDREWGPPMFLTRHDVATDYDLVVTFRLVR